MATGLDWGTSTVIAAKNVPSKTEEGKMVTSFRKQRNCYIPYDISDPSARSFLENSGAKYVDLGEKGRVYVIGEDAMRLSNSLTSKGNKVSLERPMKAGIMQGKIQDSRIMRAIAESVLPTKDDDKIVVFSLPSDPIDADFKIFAHRSMAENALSSLGWTSKPLAESVAVVYAEQPVVVTKDGEELPLTGIGVSFGGGMVNVCYAYRSVPTFAFSLANAYGMNEGSSGDWIDLQLYKAFGDQIGSVGKCTAYKESYANFSRELEEYAEWVAEDASVNQGETFWHYEVLSTMKAFYNGLLDWVVDKLTEKFEEERPAAPGPLEIVIAGGTTIPDGFETLFEQRLAKKKLPFKVAGVRKGKDPERSVTIGCLADAEVMAEEARKE